MRPTVTKILDRLADGAGGLLRGGLMAEAPGNVVRSIVESAYRPEVAGHLVSVDRESSARVISYPLEASLPCWFRREKAFDPTYTYTLSDAVVAPASGWVWFAEERLILQESVGSLNRLLGWRQGAVETRRRISQGPSPAVVLPWTGYYHWLLESVPAFLRALRRADPGARVLVPRGAPPPVADLLEAVGVPAERVRPAAGPVGIARLTMSSLPAYSGFMDGADVEEVRSVFGSDLPGGDRKVYVSRRGARTRRLPGERELESVLRARGFDIVRTEHLSLPEQARLFSQSRVVVAPHGAGLSNIVWRTAPCRVIEIFPPGLHNDCYARLASLLGFTYRHVLAGEPGEGPPGGIDPAAVLACL